MSWSSVGSKAALLAATLATALVLAAVPAEAQFRRNSDGQLLIDPLLCLSDYQVRQAIAREGFTNIALNAPIETHIRARARKGNTVYLIDFNRCGGGIVSVQPLRRAN